MQKHQLAQSHSICGEHVLFKEINFNVDGEQRKEEHEWNGTA